MYLHIEIEMRSETRQLFIYMHICTNYHIEKQDYLDILHVPEKRLTFKRTTLASQCDNGRS
jgi:hypothetical protein